MKPYPDKLHNLSCEVITDIRGFEDLEAEWDELYLNSPRATPYQSWAWLYSWWEFYGEGNFELRLVVFREEGGLIVGLFPFMASRPPILGKLLFVGTGVTDHLDVLVRDGYSEEVAKAGAEAIGEVPGWQVADFQEMLPEAAAWGVFEGWTGPTSEFWQSDCLVVEARPWEDLLMTLSKNLRSSSRRTLRKAEADGLKHEFADAEGAEKAARKMMELSRDRWRDKWQDTDPEHWTGRFESHLAVVSRRMTERGLGAISNLSRNGETIVSELLIFGHGYLGVYMIGAGDEAHRRYQISALAVWMETKTAQSRNAALVYPGRGEEPYKLRWSKKTIPNSRLLLSRSHLPWLPYAGYHLARSKAKRYAGSQNAPRWVERTKAAYLSLRALARHASSGQKTPWLRNLARLSKKS